MNSAPEAVGHPKARERHSLVQSIRDSNDMRAIENSSLSVPAVVETDSGPSLNPSPDPASPFLLSTPPTPFRESLVIAVILLAQLLARAGLSQSIAPIEYIGTTFHNTSPLVTLWFPSAFSLTAGTFILVAGRVGDIIGHKPLFLYGLAWYALWSMLAGLAAVPRNPSLVFFDVCRAMQGIATAVLTPTGLAMLGSMYKPGPRKAKVFAIFGAAAPNGVVLGALL